MEAANALNERRVQTADFIAELFPEPAEDSSNAKKGRHRAKIEKMVLRLHREQSNIHGRVDMSNGKHWATSWQLANMVTGYVQHDMTRTGKKTDDERAFMAIEDGLCDRAWDLAYQMSA